MAKRFLPFGALGAVALLGAFVMPDASFAAGPVALPGAWTETDPLEWAVQAEPADAERHVCLTFPVPRVGADCTRRSPQKVGPCGVEGRSENVNVFEPGETITVEFTETVDHPSHYRISFNPEGDAFPDPQSVDDVTSGGPFMLHDGIQDEEAGEQRMQITFPDVECESCTLQLIQVMHDKGGNGFGGRTAEGGNDDMYYSCADVALRRK